MFGHIQKFSVKIGIVSDITKTITGSREEQACYLFVLSLRLEEIGHQRGTFFGKNS